MGAKRQRKKTPRATGKAQAFANVASDSIENSRKKKEQTRKRMRVIQLQRALERKEEELRKFPKHPLPPPKPRRKGPTPPEEWKLKGAARPAALLARIAAGELDEHGNEIPKPIETIDLFEQTVQDGSFGQRPETLEFLTILKQLAEACCDAGLTDRGIQHYERCMQLDKDDRVRSREGLVCALIDEGRGDEARVLLDACEATESSAVLAYCRVILEYVSWEVLEEDGSSEDVVQEAFLKAFALNPFIAVFIAAHETFFECVEYLEEIQSPAKGSIEECFVYCSQNIGVWIDTIGACAWIEKELAELPMPEATEKHAGDEMYLGMYQTAVEMHKEAQEQETEEEDDDEEEEDDQ